MSKEIMNALLANANNIAERDFVCFPDYDKDNPIIDLPAALTVLLNDSLEEFDIVDIYSFFIKNFKF